MDADDYVPSDTEDISSDIEEIDDMSVELNKTIKTVPIPIDDDDAIVDDIDDDDDSMIESDIEDYGEEDILDRDDKNENVTSSKFAMDSYGSDDDSDNDSDDEDFQKFNETDKNDIITNFHPELYNHNYDEIQTMAKVARDNNGTIVDPLHKTLPFVTKYEKARVLGERTKQLNAGAQSFVEVDDNVIDGYLIALKEFEEKKVPFIIKRPLPNGGCEYWKLSDLEILV